MIDNMPHGLDSAADAASIAAIVIENEACNGQSALNLIGTYKTARSLVDIVQKGVFWSKKQRRAFHCIKTGLKIAKKVKKPVRFLTLTTSAVQFSVENYDEKQLNDSFRKLKQRVKRLTVAKLVKDGYVKPSDIRRYYPSRKLCSTFDMEYFKVTTNEGNGVVHCLYRGEYLPYNYVVDNWQDIHNSWDINIKLIRNHDKDLAKTSCYVVSQYVSNQDATYVRSSQSWYWVCRGHWDIWYGFLEECHSKFFYNPVQRRFYHHREEVDLFTIWDKCIYNAIKERHEPIQQGLIS